MPHANDANLPSLAERDDDAHKGRFGLVLVIGGSLGMSGAAALAGRAALRGGAGLVRVATPDVCLDSVAAHDPCYMTIPLPSTPSGKIAYAAKPVLERAIRDATVVAIGPGLGRSAGLDALVAWLCAEYDRPMVVDADALNALAERIGSWKPPAGPRVLTPHPGEFLRWTGVLPRTEEDRSREAAALARKLGVTVVLKGAGTCITDGETSYINRTGNPGMATGGSGDVLTGLIAALLAQGLTATDAARLGVHLHGLAGDLAAESLSMEALTARDLIEYLPQAFRRR